MKNKDNKKSTKIIISLIILFAAFSIVYARMNGISGLTSQTSKGCDCHYSKASTLTTLTCTSETGSFTVEPGSTTKFTVTVNNSSLVGAGIDIAVKTSQTGELNAGTLSPIAGEGLQLKTSELVHTSAKKFNNGTVSFSFNWTAPNTPGQYYLRAIGNAVNGNGKEDNNDKWNWMTPQMITVENGSSVATEFDNSTLAMPNPFRNFVNIDLSKSSTLYNNSSNNNSSNLINSLKIFDSNGNLIKDFKQNESNFVWDGKDEFGKTVAAGTYFLIIDYPNLRKVIPLIHIN